MIEFEMHVIELWVNFAHKVFLIELLGYITLLIKIVRPNLSNVQIN